MSQVFEVTKAWLELATNPVIEQSEQKRDNVYPIATIMATNVMLEIVDGEGTVHTVIVREALQQKPEVYKARVPRFVDSLLRVLGPKAISADRATLIEWLRADGLVLSVGAVKSSAPLVPGFGESDQF